MSKLMFLSLFKQFMEDAAYVESEIADILRGLLIELYSLSFNAISLLF